MSKKYVILTVISLLFVCYQNFGNLTTEELKTLNRLKELKALQAQPELSQLAQPQSGKDLESVSSDWLQRQGSIWLDGRDQRLVESMNQRLNSWLDSHRSTLGRQPASENAGSNNSSNEDGGEFRFTRINEMEYRWTKDSVLTCTLQDGGAHFDYSKKLSANTHLGFDHWTDKSQTQVHLKYNW